MSILAAITPENAENGFPIALVIFPVLLAVALVLFRPSRVDGPDRIPPGEPAWPLLLALVVGFIVWLGASVAYGTYLAVRQMNRDGPAARIDPANLPAGDLAVLATVPPLAALVCLIVVNLVTRRARGLGYGPERLWRGVLWGVVGSLMVLPLINFAGVAVEYLYRLVGYEHPEAHQLLNALQNPGSRLAQWGLILGATVAAPLFEEMLFRGHLQTLLRRGFAHLRDRAAGAGAAMPAAFAAPGYLPQAVPLPGVAQPGVPHPSFPEHAPQAYGPTARGPFAGSPQPPSMPYAAPGAYRPVPAGPPPVWASWAAIVLTSVAFALVHEAWTWPLIFLLSLCLGYAYERTSNLWVPITIHALFNTVSTVVYYVTYVQPN